MSNQNKYASSKNFSTCDNMHTYHITLLLSQLCFLKMALDLNTFPQTLQGRDTPSK